MTDNKSKDANRLLARIKSNNQIIILGLMLGCGHLAWLKLQSVDKGYGVPPPDPEKQGFPIIRVSTRLTF